MSAGAQVTWDDAAPQVKWDDEDPLKTGKGMLPGQGGPIAPMPTPTFAGERAYGETPGPLSRFAEVTTGSPHPLGQIMGREIPMLANRPGEYAKQAVNTAESIPKGISDSLLHPVDTATRLTAGPQFSEDVAAKRYGSAVADVAGAALNAYGVATGASQVPEVAESAASGLNRLGLPSDIDGVMASQKRASRMYERGVAPGSLAADDRAALKQEFTTAEPYLADEFRGRPTRGGEGGITITADRIRDAKSRLWQNTIQPAIDNFADVQRPGNDVGDAIRDSFTALDKQTKPNVVNAGENLAAMFDKPMTVREMSDLVTVLNNDKAVVRFYDLNPQEQAQAELADPSLRGKVAALGSLRQKLFDTIEESGGEALAGNFKQARQGWGALNSIEGRLRNARVPMAEGMLTRLANTIRSVYRPEYWATRETLMNLNNPERLIPRAMNMMGNLDIPVPPRTGLAAPYVPPNRMLTAGPIITPPTTEESTVTSVRAEPQQGTRATRLGLLLPERASESRPIITPPSGYSERLPGEPPSVRATTSPSIVQRDPRTGKMRRVYVGQK